MFLQDRLHSSLMEIAYPEVYSMFEHAGSATRNVRRPPGMPQFNNQGIQKPIIQRFQIPRIHGAMNFSHRRLYSLFLLNIRNQVGEELYLYCSEQPPGIFDVSLAPQESHLETSGHQAQDFGGDLFQIFKMYCLCVPWGSMMTKGCRLVGGLHFWLEFSQWCHTDQSYLDGPVVSSEHSLFGVYVENWIMSR